MIDIKQEISKPIKYIYTPKLNIYILTHPKKKQLHMHTSPHDTIVNYTRIQTSETNPKWILILQSKKIFMLYPKQEILCIKYLLIT